jgi:RNA polymerase-interacting CarD/CdnL/TRCF family regulator
MKYSVGERVVHSREGLSTIKDITNIGGNDYFVVVADKGAKENIYVMISRTENIIRPIMTYEESCEVVKYMKTVEAEFINNTKQRRDKYRKRLLSGNVFDLAYLSRQLYFFNYYNANGQVVKLGPTDLQMLKDAESILFDEFAISFNVDRDKVEDRIKELFEKDN